MKLKQATSVGPKVSVTEAEIAKTLLCLDSISVDLPPLDVQRPSLRLALQLSLEAQLRSMGIGLALLWASLLEVCQGHLHSQLTAPTTVHLERFQQTGVEELFPCLILERAAEPTKEMLHFLAAGVLAAELSSELTTSLLHRQTW